MTKYIVFLLIYNVWHNYFLFYISFLCIFANFANKVFNKHSIYAYCIF